MKKLLLIAGVAAPLALAGVAFAVTVPSDYVQDVTAGQTQLSTDQSAKTQADAVKGGESVDGQVDGAQEQVDETVSDQESNMGDTQSGEAVHGDASSGESDSSTKDGSSAGTSNSTNTTTTNGGTSQ